MLTHSGELEQFFQFPSYQQSEKFLSSYSFSFRESLSKLFLSRKRNFNYFLPFHSSDLFTVQLNDIMSADEVTVSYEEVLSVCRKFVLKERKMDKKLSEESLTMRTVEFT